MATPGLKHLTTFLAREEESHGSEELSSEAAASLERGLADVKAGRVQRGWGDFTKFVSDDDTDHED